MAVSLVAHANWQGATSPGNNTTGATVIVVVLATIGASVGVTDNKGNSYLALNDVSAAGTRHTQMYYVIAPVVGTGHTFSVTAPVFAGAVMLAFNPTSPVFDTQSAGGTSVSTTVQPGSLTPGGATNLIITSLGGDGDVSFAINSGFTIGDTSPYSGGVALSASCAYLEQASATAQNPTWTVGSLAGASLGSASVSFTFTGGGASAGGPLVNGGSLSNGGSIARGRIIA